MRHRKFRKRSIDPELGYGWTNWNLSKSISASEAAAADPRRKTRQRYGQRTKIWDIIKSPESLAMFDEVNEGRRLPRLVHNLALFFSFSTAHSCLCFIFNVDLQLFLPETLGLLYYLLIAPHSSAIRSRGSWLRLEFVSSFVYVWLHSSWIGFTYLAVGGGEMKRLFELRHGKTAAEAGHSIECRGGGEE